MKVFEKIKNFFSLLTIIFLGMFGGQKNKGARRFGIPFFSILIKFKRLKFKSLAFLFLIPILCLGYGKNSFLIQVLGNDTLVRIAYGFILSLPFLFFVFKKWLLSAILLIIAFSVRAGSLGRIGTFDLLWEDILRYGTLGFIIIYIVGRSKYEQ